MTEKKCRNCVHFFPSQKKYLDEFHKELIYYGNCDLNGLDNIKQVGENFYCDSWERI